MEIVTRWSLEGLPVEGYGQDRMTQGRQREEDGATRGHLIPVIVKKSGNDERMAVILSRVLQNAYR